MSLKHEDVQEILKLLDDSPYNELNLETEHFTLYLKRSGDSSTGWTQSTFTKGIGQAATLPATELTAPFEEEPAAGEEGLLEVRSPMTGTFYCAPKPGAEAFVNIGGEVGKDTIICIIEVMKLMISVPAGVSGEVREILVKDAQFVEKGQLLMRVRPTP